MATIVATMVLMSDKHTLPQFTEITAVFNRYPQPIREKLWALRALVLETAAATPGAGQIVETLKWGQPSYLTVKPKSGTTIRLDAHNAARGQIGLYVHCQTNLIAAFRQRHPHLTTEGSRAIILEADAPLPLDSLRDCIQLALTYHRSKPKR
jgi:hypothetical protein